MEQTTIRAAYLTALDELWALRGAAAFESAVTKAHVWTKVSKGLKKLADEMAARMRALAMLEPYDPPVWALGRFVSAEALFGKVGAKEPEPRSEDSGYSSLDIVARVAFTEKGREAPGFSRGEAEPRSARRAEALDLTRTSKR